MSLRKPYVYWLLQVVGWLFFAIFQVFLLSVNDQTIDRMLLQGEGLQMAVNIFFTHFFRLIIIRFRWLNFKLYKLIPLVMLSIVLLSVLAAIMHFAILIAQSGFELSEIPQGALAQALVIGMLESVLVYSFWSLIYFIYLFIERYNNSLKHQASLREAELNNLRSQLNPHFIFNALNSIRALVDENPNKSKSAITQLSNILRNSLNSDRQKLVPFAEELRTVRDYLALESIRYEERLSTVYDIAPETESFYFPPLMLQTVVENGIKHGIAKLTKGGQISVSSRLENEQLLVQVRNTGQLAEKKKRTAGFGLENTRKRLEMIYGGDATFKIHNENDTTVLTEIRIPNENTHHR